MDYNTQENQDFIEEMINHLLGINGKNIREHFGEEHIEILKKMALDKGFNPIFINNLY